MLTISRLSAWAAVPNCSLALAAEPREVTSPTQVLHPHASYIASPPWVRVSLGAAAAQGSPLRRDACCRGTRGPTARSLPARGDPVTRAPAPPASPKLHWETQRQLPHLCAPQPTSWDNRGVTPPPPQGRVDLPFVKQQQGAPGPRPHGKAAGAAQCGSPRPPFRSRPWPLSAFGPAQPRSRALPSPLAKLPTRPPASPASAPPWRQRAAWPLHGGGASCPGPGAPAAPPAATARCCPPGPKPAHGREQPPGRGPGRRGADEGEAGDPMLGGSAGGTRGWKADGGARAQAARSVGGGVGQPPEGRWPRGRRSGGGTARGSCSGLLPARTCPGAGPRDRKGGQERGLVAAGPRKSPRCFYFLRERGSLALPPGRTLLVGGEEEPQSSAQERGHPGSVQG